MQCNPAILTYFPHPPNPPPPQIERVKAEHEAKEAEQDAQQRKEFEAALALKRRFAPMLPFRHAFEEAVNKVCGWGWWVWWGVGLAAQSRGSHTTITIATTSIQPGAARGF